MRPWPPSGVIAILSGVLGAMVGWGMAGPLGANLGFGVALGASLLTRNRYFRP